MCTSMRLTLSFIFLSLVSTPSLSDEANWLDRITFKGDLRLRYERIDEDFEIKRNRMRFRARFGLSATIKDDVKVVLQLASGGDNPVSTNQSFDDGFSTKDIRLDLAYVDWSASDQLTLYAGKMKNPLFRAGGAPLIWDGDLNPEGFAAQYESGIFFGMVAGFWAEERSTADDSLLYAAQAGVKVDVAANADLTAGLGYFAYTDTIGNQPFFDARSKGNSVDLNNNYVFDYKDIELFVQLDTVVGDWPLQIFAHLAQNNEVSQEDSAIAIGAKVGSAKVRGSSEYSWTYQDIEADSVIGTFNDSDFGGGGTDSSGHILRGKYMLTKKIGLGGTLFINEVDRFQGTKHDYSRIQIDLEFKFE